jgi:CBS domain-containing protein
MSILDAVNTLSDHHILSAPVRDVDQPDDASWVDKYIGVLDMIGVVFHMLERLGADNANPEDFKAEIGKIEEFRNTTVKDAITFTRFGPFIPVEYDRGNLLDCMLLGGQHGIRRIPIVKSPGGDLVNIITQSALVQTLSANLSRFGSVADKTLLEVGLGKQGRVITISIDQPLREAFKLIQEHDISAVPVIDGGKICGNISARDVRLIVNSSKIYKLFNMSIRAYLDVVNAGKETAAVTCSPDDTLHDVIKSLVQSRIHRVYVVNAKGEPMRVVSLRNILKKFVREPEGYFGHFFTYTYTK